MDRIPPHPPELDLFPTANEPIALNARILLGKYDTSPAGKIDANITPENLTDTAPTGTEKPSQKFAKAMAVGVAQTCHNEYQKDEHRGKNYDARIIGWVQKTTKSLNEHSMAAAIKTMKIPGVNLTGFTTAECAKMYDRYFGAPSAGDKVNIVKLGDKQFYVAPNIQLFIDDAYASFKDQLDNPDSITAIRYLADMFGKDNVELIMAGIRAKEIAGNEEKRKELAKQANDAQGGNNRRNVFNADLEKKELDKLKTYADMVASSYHTVSRTSVTITPRPTNIPELDATPTANPTADTARTGQQEVIPADEVGKEFQPNKEYTLEGMFGRVPGDVPADHEYTIKGDPQPVIDVNRFATNTEEPFFVDVTVSPDGALDYKTNAKVIPYVWNTTGDIPRFKNAEACTNGDSGLFAVCALAGSDQEHQAKVYKTASQAILNIHKNPDFLKDWLHTQTNAVGPVVNLSNPDGTSAPTNINSVFLFVRNDKKKDGTLRPENERLFPPEEKNVGKFMDLWQRRIPELEQALAQNKLQPHHLRWIEFLSHSVDVDGMMREIKTHAAPEKTHIDRPVFDSVEPGPDVEKNKQGLRQFIGRLRSGDFTDHPGNKSYVVDDLGFVMEKPPNTGWFEVYSACNAMEKQYHMPLAIYLGGTKTDLGNHAQLIINGPYRDNPTKNTEPWKVLVYNPFNQGMETITLPDMDDPLGDNRIIKNDLWIDEYRAHRTNLDFRGETDLQDIMVQLETAKLAAFQSDGYNCAPVCCFVGAMLNALKPGDTDFKTQGLQKFPGHYGITLRTREQFVAEAAARRATPPASAPTTTEPPAITTPTTTVPTAVVTTTTPSTSQVDTAARGTTSPAPDPDAATKAAAEATARAAAEATRKAASPSPTPVAVKLPFTPPIPIPPPQPIAHQAGDKVAVDTTAVAASAALPSSPPGGGGGSPTASAASAIEADTGLTTPESEPVKQVYALLRQRMWTAFSDTNHPLNREMKTAVNTLFPVQIEGVPRKITQKELTDEKINELLKSFVNFTKIGVDGVLIPNDPLEVKIVSSPDKSEPIHIKYSCKEETNSYANFSQSPIASYLIAPDSTTAFIIDVSDVNNYYVSFSFEKTTTFPPIMGNNIYCKNIKTKWIKGHNISLGEGNNEIQECEEVNGIDYEKSTYNTTPVRSTRAAKRIILGSCNTGETYRIEQIKSFQNHGSGARMVVDQFQPENSLSLLERDQILLFQLPANKSKWKLEDKAMVVYPREAIDLDGLKEKLIKDRAILNQIDEAIPSTFTQYLITNNGKRKLLSVVPVYKYSQDGDQEKAYALVELTPTVTGTFDNFTPENTYLKLIQTWTETDQPTEIKVPDDDGTVWGTIKLEPKKTSELPTAKQKADTTPQSAQQTTTTATASEMYASPKMISNLEELKAEIKRIAETSQTTALEMSPKTLCAMLVESWPEIEKKIPKKDLAKQKLSIEGFDRKNPPTLTIKPGQGVRINLPIRAKVSFFPILFTISSQLLPTIDNKDLAISDCSFEMPAVLEYVVKQLIDVNWKQLESKGLVGATPRAILSNLIGNKTVGNLLKGSLAGTLNKENILIEDLGISINDGKIRLQLKTAKDIG